MKLTRDSLESRGEKPCASFHGVLGDLERTAEIADESLEDYFVRREIQVKENSKGEKVAKIRVYNPHKVPNPRARMTQANPKEGRAELLARIRELQNENDQLQDTLDKVAELAEAPEDGQDENHDDLVDKLNSIIDTVAPPESGDDDLGND